METGENYYLASLLFVIINRLHKNNKDNKNSNIAKQADRSRQDIIYYLERGYPTNPTENPHLLFF